MKPIHLFRFTLILTCFGILYACNKNNAGNGGTSSNVNDLQTQADDQAEVTNEDEALSNDVNTALYSQASIAGNSSASSMSGTTAVNGTEQVNGITGPISGLICDATVVIDKDSDPRTITITYNGSNCWGNRTRTGVVVISIPAGIHWGDKGAVVTVDIEDLVITRKRDNKTFTINGTKAFTNVSGGLLVNLSSLGSITHTISGSLSIGFDNGSQRVWNVSKQRVFSYDNGIVITTTGTHTDSLNNSNVAEWGINRNGIQFESLISQPKVIRQDCDFRLVSGENQVLRSDGVHSVITYGLDSSGEPTSCPGTGTYYFKVVVTKANGVILTKILPY